MIETTCGRMHQERLRNLSKVIKDPSLFHLGGCKTEGTHVVSAF